MIKNNRYQYEKMKTFPRGAIMGITKHLSGLRFSSDYGDDLTTKQINRAKELGLELDYNDSNTSGEKFTFIKPRKITSDQTKFGKAWLKQFFFKLDGSPRKGKNTEYISDETLRIAKSVSRFEFIGVLALRNGMSELYQFLPIYRTYDKKGNYFDYSPVHWGQPIIMEG